MSTRDKVAEKIEELLGSYRECLERAVEDCESPIEKLFCLATLQGDCVHFVRDPFILPHDLDLGDRAQGFADSYEANSFAYRYWVPRGLYLLQHEVGPYRIDIAFIGEKSTRVAIELDGHDFHEKTKEQAQRDKSRDRYLQKLGWKVFRFTGSEVYRDAFACAFEIEEYLHSLDT